MKLGGTYVEIRARYDRMKKDLDEAKGSVDAARRDMQRVIASVNWGVITAGATIATAAAVSGFKRAVDAASALTETQNKVNQIFGAGAKTINDWASNSVNAFGLSRQAALDAAGTMGNMWKQLGATTGEAAKNSMAMVQLSADIASFHNVSGGAVKVLEDMQSAFRGEYDPIQKYIPMINAASVEQEALANTGKKAGKELTFLEKAVAAQELIMRGAGAAVGDFNRTADEYANKTRIMHARVEDLTAKIGISLIPVAEDIVNKVDAWVDANDDLLAQRVAGWVDETYTSVKSMVDLYGSLPAEVVAGAGAGVVGRIIFGGWTPAYLIGSVAALNEGLKNFDLNLGNLYKFDQSDVEPFQNLWAVITGKKDWNTGAALGQPLVKSFPITMPAVAPAVAPAPVETASSAVSTATKKAASEQLKIRKEFSDKYQELVLDDYDYAVLTLNQEVKRYKAAGVDKTQLAEYYTRKLGDLQNEHLAVAEGSNNEQYESDLTKWQRIETAGMAAYQRWADTNKKEVEETAEANQAKAAAYRRLYDDIGGTSSASYRYKVGLLRDEYLKLRAILGDSEMLQAAYARRKKELDWEMRLSGDNFLDGMMVGWGQYYDKQKTMAEHGRDLFVSIHQSMASTFGDVFYDAITGDLKDLEDYADAVWKSIAKAFADMLGQLVADWAVSGAKGLLSGDKGAGLVSGIIGAAGGIWDAVDWMGSDMLGLWHSGAWTVDADQVAKLQAGEMVVPADQAEHLRGLIEASGGGTGWGEGLADAASTGTMDSFAADAIAAGALAGAVKGIASQAALGIGYGAEFGDVLGAMAKGGIIGGVTGAAGLGAKDALGLTGTAADVGFAAGVAAAAALGATGPIGAIAGLLGALGVDAVADLADIRSLEKVRDALEDIFGYFEGRQAFATPARDSWGFDPATGGYGFRGYNFNKDTGFFGLFGTSAPEGVIGDALGAPVGGFDGYSIGGSENVGGFGGYSFGGYADSLADALGSYGAGLDGGIGGGGFGDPGTGDASAAGGYGDIYAHGGWATGPITGYGATLHGTEYVLNQDQIKAIRDIAGGGGGRGAVVKIYFDSPELERFVKVKSQNVQIQRELRAQRGRRDTVGSTPARVY